MQQTRLHEGRLVEWRCVDGHRRWQDNTFKFALRESNGETSVRFVQQYRQELDDDTHRTYKFNWSYSVTGQPAS